MIETAKANGLDPYRYLTWVLRTAPGMGHGSPDWAAKLLPEYAPDACRVRSAHNEGI